MGAKNQEKEASRLRIVSLGGVDEIGKNMYVFEYEDDIVVVDNDSQALELSSNTQDVNCIYGSGLDSDDCRKQPAGG